VSVTYSTVVISDGNHASIAIPDDILEQLGGNRRAALRITVNCHTYESTATAVGGECRVVFPRADRAAAGVEGGETVTVRLELITGYREVDLHPDFTTALDVAGLREKFDRLAYSHRKEFARAIAEAKADDTRRRRIVAAIEKIRVRMSGS
jgi:hypothetical protein